MSRSRLIPREHYLSKLRNARDSPFIKVITGIRRCGKSTLMEMFIDELKANPLQVKDENLLGFTDYVNVYKESNPDSFLTDDGAGTPPNFSGKSNPPAGKSGGDDETKPKVVPTVW